MIQRLFFALLLRPFVNHVMGKRVHGAQNLPSEDPFLLVANHDSHLDTPLLLSLFPGSRLSRIRPVAAADYWGSGLKRFVSEKLFRVLPIARSGAEAGEAVARMEEALDAGESLILFPEGTRGDPEVLQPFRSGAARAGRGKASGPRRAGFPRQHGTQPAARQRAVSADDLRHLGRRARPLSADVAQTREAIEHAVRALAEKAGGGGATGSASSR